MPVAAVPPVSEVDPIFAAIEAHKKLVEESLRLYGALDEAKGDASEKHGHRPCPLIMWRNYFIGDTEIDARARCIASGSRCRS